MSTPKMLKVLVASLVAFPLLVTLTLVLQNPPANRIGEVFEASALENAAHNVTSLHAGSEDVSSQFTEMPKDKLLGGLLASGFDEGSCLSRYQSSLLRRPSLHKPSSYLLSRLRSYEDLHKRCGPYTKSYNRAQKQLKSNHSASFTKCKYVVWISYSGLGNRVLTLTSTFLYALLTNRVLLVDQGIDMADLFCEPFPEKSWFLPVDFPLKETFKILSQKFPHSYGNMLRKNILNTSTVSLPSYLYLHLAHDYDDHDKLFLCDQDQTLLSRVPWLIMKSDNYFVPSLFLMPYFEQELSKLFPQKDTVFHHLGRYLFHPSNHVWGLITRYYEAYLAKANETIGIQIRNFDTGPSPFQYVMDQVLACTLKYKVLPQVDRKRTIVTQSEKANLKAILITSLSSGYFENVRNMYWEYPTVNGDVVEVFQPSQEQFQHTENRLHNSKAWAEMYLLSLTDALVTSAWSTFGYVAQGLGGLKPWILYKSNNQTTPNPPCRMAMSMEPCFHAPPFYDCKTKKGIDNGAHVPHVRHCEDMSWGIKLVDNHDEL